MGANSGQPVQQQQWRRETMEKKQPEELVEEQLTAYNARDIEAFLLPYHEEVQILEHPSGIVQMSGHQEMREVYTSLFANNPQMHCEILNRTVFGNFVVDHERLTGRVNREPFEALAIYQIEGGKITRVWFVQE